MRSQCHIVTWAAVATFDRYSPEQKEAWVNQMRAKTPEQRRDFINGLPLEKRAGARQFLRSQSMDVPE